MEYQERKLSSGRVVYIRPLTWNEFWELGERRLESKSLVEGTAGGADALRAVRLLRELPLRLCVRDFDVFAGQCSVAEIVEMERAIDALSEVPVREGNSVPAAVPTATAEA